MIQEELVVVWRVYEPCNLSCHFCGYSQDVVRRRHIVSPRIILSFGGGLAQLQQRTGRQVLVSWLGGEPLLWRELPFISRIYHNEFAVRLGLTTNGTLLGRKEIRDYLVEHYWLVTISIDGFSSFHDVYRSKAGLFDQIRRSVESLIQEITASGSMLSLRVNTILMRENVHAFEAFCMEIADWGIQELTFNQLGGIDRPEFYPDHRLLLEQATWLARELPGIQQKALDRGLKVFGTSPYLDRISASSRDLVVPIQDCNPGRRFLFINEENLISPCSFTTESYGIPVSEIKNTDTFLEMTELFHMQQQLFRAAPCNNCLSTQVFEKFNSNLQEEVPIMGNRG